MEFINANDLPAAGTMGTDNKVIVQQGNKFVLMTLAELLNYVASASVETDPTLTQESVAADALATGKAVRAARPFNMLDNSDFTNPVNQRGATAYTSNSGTYVYAIDRWKVRYGTLTVNTGSVNWKSAKEAQVKRFRQVTAHTFRATEPYTLAVLAKINDASGDNKLQFTLNSGEIITSKNAPLTKTDDYEWFLFTIRPSTAYEKFTVEIFSASTTSDYIDADIKAICLYDGEYTADTLPEYQPKGYAAELLECQRYFVAINGNDDAAVMITDGATNGTTFYAFIPLPTAMRGTVVPTVTYKSVDIYPYTVGVGVPVTDLASVTIPASRNAICARFGHASSNMAATAPGTLRLSAGGYIHISAEL